jgi:6-phosphogluconolactonase
MGMIRILPDPPALAQAAAEAVARGVRRAVDEKGSCTLVLAGGSTPVLTYQVLARQYAESVPWDGVRFLWGDERMVPADHEDSNYAMARRTLLDPLGVPAEAVFRIRTELGSAAKASADYEERIRKLLPPPPSPPHLDLVLLGLGEDGHTASLKPGCPALQEEERLVAPCLQPSPDHHRVTMTLPLLNAAGKILFLVSGERKAAVLKTVLETLPSDPPLPAQRIQPSSGRLVWLADRDSAGGLKPDRVSRVGAEGQE